MKILLDTNFLLLPAMFRVDIFAEVERVVGGSHEFFTINPVVRELRGLAMGKGKDCRAAKVGLQLLEKENVEVLETDEENADEAILKMVEKEDFVVATQDAELRERVREKNRKVIYLRAKQYLVLV